MDALTKSPSALLIVNDSALTMGLEEKMQQTPQEDDPSWPFSMCILSIAFGVFGAFGNSLVILVLFSASILNTTDVLVLALAINDLVGSVVVVPMDVNMYLTNFACLQNLGVCMFYHIVFYLVFTQSNSLLMEIAIDRFLLVCFPFESYLTKTLCVKILFCGLIVSLALGTITGLASCLPDVQLAVIMFISDWLMVFVMCLTIVTITASYTAIYVAIRNHKKKMIKNCNPMAGYVGTANSKLVTSAHRNNVSVIPSTLKDKPSATVTKHSAIYSNFNVDTVKCPKETKSGLLSNSKSETPEECAASNQQPVGKSCLGVGAAESRYLELKQTNHAMHRTSSSATSIGVEIQMFAEVHAESSTDFTLSDQSGEVQPNGAQCLEDRGFQTTKSSQKEDIFVASSAESDIKVESAEDTTNQDASTESGLSPNGETNDFAVAVISNSVDAPKECGNCHESTKALEKNDDRGFGALGLFTCCCRGKKESEKVPLTKLGLNIRRQDNQQQRVAFMMFLVTIVFLIGCTPNFLLLLQLQLNWTDAFVIQPFLPLTNACYHFTFAANPIIYAALSSKFREQTSQFYQVHIRNFSFKRSML